MTFSIPGLTEQDILAFVMVLTRIGAVMALAPMYAGRAVPGRVKVILALSLAILLTPTALKDTHTGALDTGVIGVAGLLTKEAVVGLAIGLAAGAVTAAWQFAGSVLDLSIGFSYGGVLDPITGNQSQLIQQIYGLLAVLIFITLGGDQYVLGALAHSFQVVPLDGQPPSGDYASFALMIGTQVFVIGLGVVAPILVALLVVDVAFGLMARVAPQTQIMQVEFPVKVAVGLAMIAATLPFTVSLFSGAIERLLSATIGG